MYVACAYRVVCAYRRGCAYMPDSTQRWVFQHQCANRGAHQALLWRSVITRSELQHFCKRMPEHKCMRISLGNIYTACMHIRKCHHRRWTLPPCQQAGCMGLIQVCGSKHHNYYIACSGSDDQPPCPPLLRYTQIHIPGHFCGHEIFVILRSGSIHEVFLFHTMQVSNDSPIL